jgi:dTDP-glucose 4,6-dehydratase
VYDDGARTRSFCFVDDTVDGMIRLLHSKESTPVNMGNPHEMTILEFAHKVLGLVGSDSEITFVAPTDARTADDPKVRSPDISKAKHTLGWEPRTSLDEGLQQTIEYFRGKLGLV